jgi:hypothetical protein
MHQTFLNGTTRTLERICGRAKSNKCKTLIAPDVEELYNNIYDCMNRMEDEGFDSPFDKLDEVAMQQLDIDLVVMTDFAKIYDSGDIMTVKPKIADLAKLYKDALTIWSDRTGLKFIRVLPDYTIRRE